MSTLVPISVVRLVILLELVFLDRNVWSDSKIHKFILPKITIAQAREWRGIGGHI